MSPPASGQAPATAMTDRAIIVDGLRKRYGKIVALDGLSFDVPAGTIVGLLGGERLR